MTANPNNTQATAVSLGSLYNGGDWLNATGNNTTGTSAWYSITLSGAALGLTRITVTGATGDDASLFWSIDSRTLGGPSTDFTVASLNGSMTLYIQVTGGTAGGTFTITATVLVGPPDATIESGATSIGTLTGGGSALTATDSNHYGDVKWYSVTVPSNVSPVNIAVSGDGYDAATLYSGGGIAGASTSMNESFVAGTAYIAVAGGTAGDSFTLTITPPA